MPDAKPVIVIGIPCYGTVAPEVLQDYMRFAYYLGRRYQEYDFALAIKTKTEQFRARNAIVEAAYQVNADWLLMLDDDHIIDIEDDYVPTARYEFLRKLIEHDKDIIGALYYHRGGECRPVLMQKDELGRYSFLRDDQIKGGLQKVDVQGGGCMLVKMKVFDKLSSPWFEPEFQFGTDIQLCSKSKDAGFEVWSDTSIEIGHVINERNVITSINRHQFYKSAGEQGQDVAVSKQLYNILSQYKIDVMQYIGARNTAEFKEIAKGHKEHQAKFHNYEQPVNWYRDCGKPYLARQALAHDPLVKDAFGEYLLSSIKTTIPGVGIDYGCGSAPITFEFARAGHIIYFVDLDGCEAFEFLKWRAKKYDIFGTTAKFNEWPPDGGADYAILADSIEHFDNWREILANTRNALKQNGAVLTNFMLNTNTGSPEHIFMDKIAFSAYMTEIGLFAVNMAFYQRRDDLMMKVAA